MPTQVPFFASETRSLWVTPGPSVTTLQVQDGAWFSDRFLTPTSRLEALAIGFETTAEYGSIEGESVLRLRWSTDQLVLEIECETRFFLDEQTPRTHGSRSRGAIERSPGGAVMDQKSRKSKPVLGRIRS